MPEARLPSGTLGLGDLQRRWAQVDLVRSYSLEAEKAWDRRVVCPRSVDEGQTGGHRVYVAAERYLSIADENHDALVGLLEHVGATPTAPWNLLRPSFEASFYALWLLVPDDSIKRRQRGIHLEWLDDEAARKYYDVVLGQPKVLEDLGIADLITAQPAHRENTQIYTREADKVGLGYRSHDKNGRKVRPTPHSVNVEDQLGRVVDDPTLAFALKMTWKTLSGIQHAEGSAMLRVSDSLVQGVYPGGQRMLLTINDGAFYVAAIATTTLRVLAWERYGERHRPMRSGDPIDLGPLRALAARALQKTPPS